jgi:hypothetical protein
MNQKRHYPVSNQKRHPAKKHHHTKRKRPNHHPPQTNLFQGNIANNMNFGGQGHDLSGYVQRTLVMKDRHGNIQIAKEKQFFNSSKNGMRVRVYDDDKE